MLSLKSWLHRRCGQDGMVADLRLVISIAKKYNDAVVVLD